MDHLDVIPEDEVRSVTIQLVTYNGNLQSAYGTISIDFDFNHGTEAHCVCCVDLGPLVCSRLPYRKLHEISPPPVDQFSKLDDSTARVVPAPRREMST